MHTSRLGIQAAAVVAAALLALAAVTVARAQATTPAPPQPGDIAWAFAPENPLFDDRVAAALGTLMEPSIRAATPSGARIVRLEPNGPDVVPAAVYPDTEVPKLLAAAGFGDRPPFVEVGQCHVWVAPVPAGVTPAVTPAVAAPIVVAALHDALASLGVPTTACAETSDPAHAQLLVWVAGGPVPTLTQRNTATFLAPASPPPAAPAPASPPPGTGPAPASSGNAGLTASADNRGAGIAAIGLVVLAGALVAGGRRLTRRGVAC